MTTQAKQAAGARTQVKPFKQGENVTWIIPPNIEAMMTGVHHVLIGTGNRCCAVYEDGSREYAILQKPVRNNFFSLVGQIQEEARA